MLTLRSKTPIKFEFSDGVQETTVTIAPDEDSEALRAKLERVLELEAGQALPARRPGAALAAAVAEFEPLLDIASMETQATKVGWEALADDTDIENLPEY